MKIRPEHIVAGTALGMLFNSLLCQLVAKHWHIPNLLSASKWFFVAGITAAFLPLLILLIIVGWEKATHSRTERDN